MFRILESIAALEMNKDAKKFNIEKIKAVKKKQKRKFDDRRQSYDNATQLKSKVLRNKQHNFSMSSEGTKSNQDNQLTLAMDFDEEDKQSDSSSIKSGQNKSRQSSAGETEFKFDTDEEEDIFLDA